MRMDVPVAAVSGLRLEARRRGGGERELDEKQQGWVRSCVLLFFESRIEVGLARYLFAEYLIVVKFEALTLRVKNGSLLGINTVTCVHC